LAVGGAIRSPARRRQSGAAGCALKPLWRLRAVTLVDFRLLTPHSHPTPLLVSAPSSNRAWALTATAQPAKTPREQ
jgi:hypothetical protein